MSPTEIEQSALQLPVEGRLRLVRLLIESVSNDHTERDVLANESLARVYGDNEPEYTLADIRH